MKSEIGTFFKAFPNGVVWGNTNNGQGYDLVLMGQVEPIKINLDRDGGEAAEPGVRAGRRSRSARSASTRPSSCSRPTPGTAQDLAPWLKDAAINRDRNLRLQYLAGMGLNLYQSGPI